MEKALIPTLARLYGMLRNLNPVSFLLILSCMLLLPGPLCAETRHNVYFEDTDYELHVYEILGDYPGNTMLIIGGMHNEPGGYLSADLYADLSLHQGTLLVVPRANFPVIVSNNRKIHSDMNRKFINGTKQKDPKEYEESVVEILKKLMARSDILLNLHDGSGFYRPTYENSLKNPKRWGQSIITDTDDFFTPDGRTVYLKQRVERVLDKVNPSVQNTEHRFYHHNTRTFDSDSGHKDQRKSATFYALTEYGIEAYGVETSKEISSLDLKVRYQSMIINGFMEEFGIIPSNPKVSIKDPELQYLLVSVNGSFPHGIPNLKTLYVNSGDTIRIEHIAANYERGLMADIQGIGSLNDLNKEFIVDKPYSILVKKDQFECGKVHIALNSTPAHPPVTEAKTKTADEFLILVNDGARRVPVGETLEVSSTDTLVIQDISLKGQDSAKLKINFVGFVGNKRVNDAEDRGYKIQTRSLWTRYSLDKNGELYRIEATLNEDAVAEMFVRVRSPQKTR